MAYHTPRCPPVVVKQEELEYGAAGAAQRSRKRRAEQDLGEAASRPRTPSPRRTRPAATTKRVTPPKPTPSRKKARTGARPTRTEDDIMRLLDETHARRMAAEAAVAAVHTK